MRDWKGELARRLRERRIDPTLHTAVIEELSQHLEDRFQSLVARGMTVDEAAASVLRELEDEAPAAMAGRPGRMHPAADALVRELAQAERQRPRAATIGRPAAFAGLRSAGQDLRYAVRALRKSPGFTLVAALTLALGVGVNTAIFSVVNAVMLRPLPYHGADRLVRLFESNPERGWPQFSTSEPNFLDWRAQATSWEALAATGGSTMSITADQGAEVVRATRVTSEFLDVLGTTPALGRNFRPEETQTGSEAPVVIIVDGLWRRMFGADPNVVGQTLPLNGQPFTIIGVLPPQFEWGANLALLLPLRPDPTSGRGDHQLSVIGRLKPGVPLETARAEMSAIAARLAQQYPADNEGWGVLLLSFYDWLIPESTRQSLVVLQAAVGFVLLIACANVANLLLARGASRQKELAVRIAIGASRGRILWHSALESALLGGLGAAAGVGLASVTIRLLSVYAATAVPRLDEASIDARVLAFAIVAAVGCAVLAGVLPALPAGGEQGARWLHDTSRGTTGGRARQRLRVSLTVAEVALSAALLIGAGLLLRSFVSLQDVDAGFDVNAVMTGRVMLADASAFDTPERRTDFWRRLSADISALPGILSVSTGSGLPLTSGNTSTELQVPGVTPAAGVQPSTDWRVVRPGYFTTMGIPLRGREFTEADDRNAPPTIIVSEALARVYWPNEDALGKTIRPRSLGNREHTIVGVAGDVRSFGLDGAVRPMVYYSGIAWPIFNPTYIVWRSAVDPVSHVPAIRDAIRRINPRVALYEVVGASDLLSTSFGPRRLNLYLLGLFAAIALLLSAVGLFGVMAYLVSQRTREIGVRLALGATRAQVVRLVVGRGVILAAGGAAIGLAAAFWLTQFMESLLFSVSPNDPATFAAVAGLLLVVATLACYVPARRAMRVDPVTALRSE